MNIDIGGEVSGPASPRHGGQKPRLKREHPCARDVRPSGRDELFYRDCRVTGRAPKLLLLGTPVAGNQRSGTDGRSLELDVADGPAGPGSNVNGLTAEAYQQMHASPCRAASMPGG